MIYQLMRRFFMAVLPIVLLEGNVLAKQPPLQCPALAPSEWGLAQGSVLSGVNILEVPRGKTIDESAPPSLMPDTQSIHNHALHQTWKMNGDGPDWSYFIDCHYRSTDRILRLDGTGLSKCEYDVFPYTETNQNEMASSKRLRCD